MTPPKTLFISYAREDGEVAKRLFLALRKQPGVTPWLDSENLLPGARWTDEVLRQIEACDFILVLLSRRSVTKEGFVQREIRESIERLLNFPPDRRVLIPIRLEPCQPSHRELRKLHYLDMFPSWDDALTKLFHSIGVRKFTHNFIALGTSKRHPCRLAPLGATYGMPPSQVVPVNVSNLPPISADRVPSVGLAENGTASSLFHGLWTSTSRSPCYRKSDWKQLWEIMFAKTRTKKQRQTLARILRRQWALAQEQPRFDDSPWRKLHGFLQTHFP
jgi:TIR domain